MVQFDNKRRTLPRLDMLAFYFRETGEIRKEANTGAAWLSSARVVRCWVKSSNERNPYVVLTRSQQTAPVNGEEGGDDVKSAWPLCLGLHTCYNGVQQWVAKSRDGANLIKPPPSSDWRLQLASMKPESLVNARQP